jgi:thiamine-phosphate pyrophosphorylase
VPRLYLATPEVEDPTALIAGLPDLLGTADIAAVLVRLKPTDQRTMSNWSRVPAPMAHISPASRPWRMPCRV